MPSKSISFRLIAVATLLAGVAVAVLLWSRYKEQDAAVILVSIPEIPDLSAWPRDYAARVRVSTVLARGKAQPIQALKELACLYHANGFYREAQQVEIGLHTLQPEEPQWTYFIADTFQNLGDPDNQRIYLEKMLRLVPSYPVTRLKLAELLFKQGLIDEAHTHYEWRLSFVPGDPYALLGLARIALQRGDRAGAVEQLEALVRKVPEFSTAHNLLAGIYERMGDKVRAEQQRQLGSSTGRFVEANDPRLYLVYAWSFDATLVEAYGQGKAQQRQWEHALPFYEKAVRLLPKQADAFEALAGMYQHLGRLKETQATLEAGLVVAPDVPRLYLSLSRILDAGNRRFEARKVIEKGVAVARKIGDAQAVEHLSQELQRLAL